MANALQSLSQALADTVEAQADSVVRVEGRRRRPASGIIWSADGLLITAHHTIERDEGIRVGLPDGKMVEAVLVGRDPTTDLAVLRLEAGGLTAARWADLAGLRAGQIVLALGRPGRSVQATLGIISALGQKWRTPVGGEIDRYVQTDVIMYPGFSGGPLVDSGGDLIGLNSSVLLRGVSVTIPALTVKQVAEMLIAYGRVRRGYLGVGAQPVRLPDSLRDQLQQETGLILISVDADSPAEKGGLLMGDTLVSLDGEMVCYPDDLLALLSGDRIGKSIPARIIRSGQLQSIEVTIGERG